MRQNITACAIGLGVGFVAAVAHIERIDVGNGASRAWLGVRSAREVLQRLFVRAGGFERFKLGPQDLDVAPAGPPQGDAAGEAIAHGARNGDVRRRPGAAIAGAAGLNRALALHLPLREVGQLEILQEEVEEFVIGQRKAEFVFALAVGAAAASRPVLAADAECGRLRRIPCCRGGRIRARRLRRRAETRAHAHHRREPRSLRRAPCS